VPPGRAAGPTRRGGPSYEESERRDRPAGTARQPGRAAIGL
jgi:hypothetical protein